MFRVVMQRARYFLVSGTVVAPEAFDVAPAVLLILMGKSETAALGPALAGCSGIALDTSILTLLPPSPGD
jgi:hypothetical protein